MQCFSLTGSVGPKQAMQDTMDEYRKIGASDRALTAIHDACAKAQMAYQMFGPPGSGKIAGPVAMRNLSFSTCMKQYANK